MIRKTPALALILTAMLVGCGGGSGSSTPAGVETDITASLNEMLGTPLITTKDKKPADIVSYTLGDLSLPSGKIAACDPFDIYSDPFTQTVPPGKYAATLVTTKIGGDQRVAFVVVRFSQEPVATWKPASIDISDDPEAAHEDPGYYSNGYGALWDSDTASYIWNKDDKHIYADMESDLKKNKIGSGAWARIETSKGWGVLFSADARDGASNTSFFGLDAAGKPAVLITDCNVITWPRRPKTHSTTSPATSPKAKEDRNKKTPK